MPRGGWDFEPSLSPRKGWGHFLETSNYGSSARRVPRFTLNARNFGAGTLIIALF